MIKFGITPEDAPPEIENPEKWMLDKTMEMAIEAGDLVNAGFIKPIYLEFEKIYYPYLLMNKKRYAALLWTNSEKFDYMDCKGLETVRRDNCALIRKMLSKCLTTILMEKDVEKAICYVHSMITSLLKDEIDISDLIITKTLNKKSEDMKAIQSHVVLADKMMQRDANTAPKLGDRVPFVYIQSMKNAKGFEKVEHPLYVLENKLTIDVQYYLKHQLEKPLIRLFEPIIENAKSVRFCFFVN